MALNYKEIRRWDKHMSGVVYKEADKTYSFEDVLYYNYDNGHAGDIE